MIYRNQTSAPVSLLPKTLRTLKQALYDRGVYDAKYEGTNELPVLNMCDDNWKSDELLAWNAGYTDEKEDHASRYR